MSMFSKDIKDWVSEGRFSQINGHKIFIHASGPKGKEGVLVVHGYPGSSWDWSGVVGPVVSIKIGIAGVRKEV